MADYSVGIDLGLLPVPNFEDRDIHDAISNIHDALVKLAGESGEESIAPSINTAAAYVSRLDVIDFTDELYYALATSTYMLIVDASANDVTIQIPNFNTCLGFEFVIKVLRKDVAYTITVFAPDLQRIDELVSVTVGEYEAIRLKATVYGWIRI